MGKLQELMESNKAQLWGYRDSRRNLSLRLDREYRDSLKSKPKESSLEPPDWFAYVESHDREHTVITPKIVALESKVFHLERKRKPKGDF